jgi:hypothetical protein
MDIKVPEELLAATLSLSASPSSPHKLRKSSSGSQPSLVFAPRSMAPSSHDSGPRARSQSPRSRSRSASSSPRSADDSVKRKALPPRPGGRPFPPRPAPARTDSVPQRPISTPVREHEVPPQPPRPASLSVDRERGRSRTAGDVRQPRALPSKPAHIRTRSPSAGTPSATSPKVDTSVGQGISALTTKFGTP